MSICGKCGHHSFRLQRNEPLDSKFAVYFVQCTNCNVPVGVLEYANSAAILRGVIEKIDSLTDETQQISYDIASIKNQIRR